MIFEITILTITTINLGLHLYNHMIINSQCFNNSINKNGNNSVDDKENIK